ncbi:MAG: hypothetical protein Q8P81_03430 [Nanoarchaeota archaeon]|nr:hypothetical protein [Nanoarchaeota archaeon]
MPIDKLQFLITFCTFFIVGIFLTNLLHEISHLIVALIGKYEITDFKPWPHKNPKGQWYAGAIYYIRNDDLKYLPAMLCAPLYKAYIFFTIWSLLGFYYFPLWGFALAELSDYIEFWCCYLFNVKESDGYRFKQLLKGIVED